MLVEISMVVPTMRPECITTCLMSILNSFMKPKEIIVIDDCKGKHLVDNDYFRQIIAALFDLGIKTKLIRNTVKRPLSRIRAWYFQKTKYDLILGMDDDAAVDQYCLALLYRMSKVQPHKKYYLPILSMPRNLQNLKFFDQTKKNEMWVKKRYSQLKGRFAFCGQWWHTKKPIELEVDMGSGSCILFRKDIKVLKEQYKLAPKAYDDQYLTKALGKGIVFTGAISYHFAFTDPKRNKVDQSLRII